MRDLAARSMLLLLALSAGLARPALGGPLYRWTNDRGEVHFTEGIESVPPPFRAGATLLGDLGSPAPPAPSTPAPSTPAPEGTPPGALARIPFVPGSPIVVTARINGGRSVQLVFDTGADRTMISPRALSALGADVRPVRRGTVQGVTGTSEVDFVVLQSLEVGEAKAEPLEVIAHEAGLTRGEGLLGRDFLDRFIISIDTRARVLVLSKR